MRSLHIATLYVTVYCIIVLSVARHCFYGEFISRVLTYLLTPWCRVLLEQLTGLQLVKKFPAFHGTRRFITAFTSVFIPRIFRENYFAYISRKLPSIFDRLCPNLDFLNTFSQKFSKSNFTDIPRMGGVLMNVDRRTDRHEEANRRLW